MGIKGFTRISILLLVFALLIPLLGCGGGSSKDNPASSKSKSSDGTSDGGDDSAEWSDVILELKKLQSNITISNISITNLDCLNITNKVTDSSSTSARAVASYHFADLQTSSQVTSHGSVEDASHNGKLYASSSLEYTDDEATIFKGNRYSLSAEVTSESYGYAHALATISEMIYFTVVKACDITFSFEYSGTDNGINPGLDPYNYSYAGINFQIANFTDAESKGMAINVLDAEKISPGTLRTTMHFEAGENGWITLGVSAGASVYRPDPSLEENSSYENIFW